MLFNAILFTYKKNSFMPKCSAIEPIFLFRHPMEKYIELCKALHIAFFIDLEKASDKIPKGVYHLYSLCN